MSVVASQTPQGIHLIAISGRFDFSCHPDFRASFSSLQPGNDVVVDLGGTTYIDSAALGMLLLLRDRVGDARHVRLTNCKGQPDQVLRIANFHRLFQYDGGR